MSRENKSVTFYRLPGAGHGAASGGALGSPLCSASNALGRFKVYVDGVTRLCPMGGGGGGDDSGIGLCCPLKSFAPRSDPYCTR